MGIYIPVGKIAESIFDNMSLYFECRINKKHSFRMFFLAILPTGISPLQYVLQYFNI